jgi:hypothetical protein
MSTRQEQVSEAPRQRANTPHGAIPKFKKYHDWDNLPDYDRLPDWALIDKAEVALLTNMAPSVIERRVAAGEFRPPTRHGKNDLWPVGYVRDWIKGLKPEGGA